MEFELLIIKGKQKNNMAKKIATKVNYQTTISEQKRDFYTTKALYNAKRLSSILNKAKVGAMALVLTIGMVACGSPVSSDATATDSTAVASDSTKVDTTATAVDTTSVVK